MTVRIAMVACSALALASCANDPGHLFQFENSPLPDAPGPSNPTSVVQALSCTVDVEPRVSFSCQPTGGMSYKGEAPLIVGGQGTYLQVANDSVSRTGDVVTIYGVSVTNRMLQRLGTALDLPPAEGGIRVFFEQLPDNEVVVGNPDGTSAFTASGQPYFLYADTLDPLQTTAKKHWQFDLSADPGVTGFSFGLLVQGAIPNEQGVLVADTVKVGSSTWNAVWAVSETSVIVVGSGGSHTIYNGSSWSTPAQIPGAGSETLRKVWASGEDNIWVVGSGKTFIYYDGDSWQSHMTGLPPDSAWDGRGVWGTSDGDTVFVVVSTGAGQPGYLYRTTRVSDSWSAWTKLGDLGFTPNSIHGSSGANVWIALQSGRVARWNNDNGIEIQNTGVGSISFLDVWVTSEEEAWAVGGSGGTFRFTKSGGTWTAENLRATGKPFAWTASAGNFGVWAPDPDYVWIARTNTDGSVMHYDGEAGIAAYPPTRQMNDIHGLTDDEFWAAGAAGVIIHAHR
ncbi:MAG TPA: hypothetical protein VNZ57_13780 [Longimicrobiales bacterium]|nr:hypothetical protein [Longimicrobiales bacterium]